MWAVFSATKLANKLRKEFVDVPIQLGRSNVYFVSSRGTEVLLVSAVLVCLRTSGGKREAAAQSKRFSQGSCPG
jgi:hypothetical protein